MFVFRVDKLFLHCINRRRPRHNPWNSYQLLPRYLLKTTVQQVNSGAIPSMVVTFYK